MLWVEHPENTHWEVLYDGVKYAGQYTLGYENSKPVIKIHLPWSIPIGVSSLQVQSLDNCEVEIELVKAWLEATYKIWSRHGQAA